MSKKFGLPLLIAVIMLMSTVVVQADIQPASLSSASATPSAPVTPTPDPTQTIAQPSSSSITIEEQLRPGANYTRSIVSYTSDGFKIYALMTVPIGDMPAHGWPVIIFNHGYIPPTKYTTTGNYDAYVDAFARHGYIIFKSDYRGNGKSEGAPRSRNGYVSDILNALTLLKQQTNVDSNRIGMWGHSMGGYVTVAAMLASTDIKAGVIWAGTLRSFKNSNQLKNLSGPLQLHHATGDETVPYRTSTNFVNVMEQAGLNVEFYTYQGDNHNLTENATTALTRSLYFFDKYVKNASSAMASIPTQLVSTPTALSP